MTTLQTQFVPHFQAPAIEDPMELTSDIDQRAGGSDDIDIDFDLTGDNTLDGEDEFMGEEGMNGLADSTVEDGLEAHATNDDEMADDNYAQGHVDEGSSVYDEVIEDAEYTAEPDVDESTIVDPALVVPNDQSEDLIAKPPGVLADQDAERNYHEPVHKDHEDYAPSITPEAESGAGNSGLPNLPIGLVNPNHDVEKVSGAKNPDDYDVGASKEGTADHDVADKISNSHNDQGLIALKANVELAGEEVHPASPALSSAAPSNREKSHSQEESSLDHAIHLHPIVLYYRGEETFLFPPSDQNEDNAATFLLKDEQLAYSAIGDLLVACRRVLSQSLREQDELMISIDDLDIHISESTAESASTRLSELVDLYVCLQQNDGLENPPPLYMDLTSRIRFSCRLDILKNASIEGKGLSQLKDPQEIERDQQRMINEETDLSSHNAVLSDNVTYTAEHVLGEEANEGVEEYFSYGSTLPSENPLQEAGSGPQGTQFYSGTDLTSGGNRITESLVGSDGKLHEAGSRDDDGLSETAGSKESLESAHPFVAQPEFQKAGESLVDDGDFIDYEEVDELEGGTSSASSTLKGDAVDATAVRDHAVPKGPAVAENQEDRLSQNVHEDLLAGEETSPNFAPEKEINDVSGLVQEEQPNLVEDLFLDSDFKGHNLSGQSDDEEEASEHEEQASISQEIEVFPDVIVSGNGAGDQLEAFAHDDDNAASLGKDTSHEIAVQVEREAYSSADIHLNGGVEDFPLSQPFQSRSGGSRSSPRDDGLGEVEDVATEDELEDVDESLGSHRNDSVSHLLERAATHPALFVDGLAQGHEDNDEITYEEDECDTAFPHEPTKAEHNVGTRPGSLKRTRSSHEDDDTLEEAFQGAKRARSG